MLKNVFFECEEQIRDCHWGFKKEKITIDPEDPAAAAH